MENGKIKNPKSEKRLRAESAYYAEIFLENVQRKLDATNLEGKSSADAGMIFIEIMRETFREIMYSALSSEGINLS